MVNAHEPFKALSPVGWDDVPQDQLDTYLQDIFAHALAIIDSVPSPHTISSASSVKPGADDEPAVATSEAQKLPPLRHSEDTLEAVEKLRKDWKEVKINPKENPLGINVFKLSAKDGKGAWFARQSLHEDLPFNKWKLGLQREFAESLKVQGSPGSGSIRGIGADKNVAHNKVGEVGELSVFQLSAQFPGPTSPRDFVTLILTSDMSHQVPGKTQKLRQYIIVSKPCTHAECPPRQNIIRGQYESVEIIREISNASTVDKNSLSSADLPTDSSEAKSSTETPSSQPPSLSDATLDQVDETPPSTVEWLMVTRSDPGGSVPRFLIEKGTPPGIVGDAGKFVKWLSSKRARDLGEVSRPVASNDHGQVAVDSNSAAVASPATQKPDAANSDSQNDNDADGALTSNGLYGIISGIFGTASSVVTTGLRQGLGGSSYSNGESSRGSMENPEQSDSDVSSEHSFSSALEKRLTVEAEQDGTMAATQSEDSKSVSQPLDKEFKRLQDKRLKLDKKVSQLQERIESKRRDEKDKDEAAVAKMQDKYDKEVAKQETKYKRELQKLEERREQEVVKAERRRRKTLEREEKSNLTLELERVRAERDIAQKHNQLLENQVKELQAQNDTLVAKLNSTTHLSGQDSPRASSLSSKNDFTRADTR